MRAKRPGDKLDEGPLEARRASGGMRSTSQKEAGGFDPGDDRAEGPLGDDVGSLQKRGDPFDLERLCGHQFLERIVFDVDVPALLCHVGTGPWRGP